ncbi:hypothetical protein [Crateriforma spongiae]|uniref:hypothetical protein n=1 Tax=Crateriforma spongiae TaxID=2724528 RepID=UPI001444C93B|nr:hypothetical protein [Crateriforma spongiae]
MMPTTGTMLAYLSVAAPAIAYLVRRHLLRRGAEPLVFILGCIACYGLLLLSLPFTEAAIEADMYSFDLNGDGIFDDSEMTPEAKAAMRRWSSDVGRNFAPFTGLFICPIWSAMVYAVFAFGYRIGNAFFRTKAIG